MNEIEELIKKIKWHLDETEGENSKGTFDQGYEDGCEYCICLLENLKRSLALGITEQQALNKLAERFPMTANQIVSMLEMSQAGVKREPVAVPELKFPQSIVDWLGEPLEMDHEDLMACIMQYYWNEDSAYDNTFSSEVGEYLAESLSNVVKLLRAMEGEPYTVVKKPLYFWRLNLQSTILYQFAIRRGSSYTLKSGFPIAECAMTEKTAKEILRKDFSLFKPIEPKLNDGTIVDAVPVEEEE